MRVWWVHPGPGERKNPNGSLSPGLPTQLVQGREFLQCKNPLLQPSSPSCPLHRVLQSCPSSALHVWADVHRRVGIHSVTIRGHSGRHLGLRGRKELFPATERKALVTDQWGGHLSSLPVAPALPHPPPSSPFHGHLDGSRDITSDVLPHLFSCGKERHVCYRIRDGRMGDK